jgi:hypothetical protein
VTSFIDPLREQLTQALSQFNRDLPRHPSVRLTTPAANDERKCAPVTLCIRSCSWICLGLSAMIPRCGWRKTLWIRTASPRAPLRFATSWAGSD